jgi:hypothetical protein
MGEIKNWPQFQRDRISPYACWFGVNSIDYAFVPLSAPCEDHATGFDGYVHNCGCQEFKWVRRSPEDVAKIKALRDAVHEEAILRQADEIRAKRAASEKEVISRFSIDATKNPPEYRQEPDTVFDHRGEGPRAARRSAPHESED